MGATLELRYVEADGAINSILNTKKTGEKFEKNSIANISDEEL